MPCMYVCMHIWYPPTCLHATSQRNATSSGARPRPAGEPQAACVRAVPCHACVHTAGRVFRFAPSRLVAPRFVSFRFVSSLFLPVLLHACII